MNRKIKILVILINLISILFIMSNKVLGTGGFELIKGFDDATNFNPTEQAVLVDRDLKSTAGKIVGLIQVVGTMVSVGMLIILGIKYVLGSAEQKAEYKKTLFPYIIGAILIFGAVNLTQIIYTWASEL